MKNVFHFLSVVFSVILLQNCASQKTKNYDNLYQMMQGKFCSEKLSLTDQSYYHISLQMHPVWKNSGEKWLYVEQAMSTSRDKPYRQRLYKVEQIDDLHFVSKVYELPNPEKFIGKWNDDALFNTNTLKKEDLIAREGCAVYLTYNSATNFYEGATKNADCLSGLRGTKYATSKVKISQSGITSWDQGFDESGKQVWGAVNGPYVFDKLSE